MQFAGFEINQDNINNLISRKIEVDNIFKSNDIHLLISLFESDLYKYNWFTFSQYKDKLLL